MRRRIDPNGDRPAHRQTYLGADKQQPNGAGQCGPDQPPSLDLRFAGRLALRAPEAARAIGIGKNLLWLLTSRGEIPHARIGRAIVYPVDELQAWLSKRAQKKGGDR